MNRNRLFFTMLAAAALPWAGSVLRAEETSAARIEKTSPQRAVPLPENLRKGLEEAKKTGRDVLVIFNTSDIAGWCERLREDIVEQPDFVTGVAANFVAVNLDFPRNTKPPEEEHRRNMAFARKYAVTGFPVVLLLDSAGRAYAKTGYTTSDVREYLAHLDAFKKNRTRRDQLIAKARRNKGDIRADLLAKALRSIDGSLAHGYPELFEELRSIDPADRSGALLDYDISRLIIRAGEAARTARSKAAGLWEFDAFIAEHPDMPKHKLQRVLVERFSYLDLSGSDGLSRKARHELLLEKLSETLSLAPGSELAPKIRRLMAENTEALEKISANEAAESKTK